MGCSTRSDFDTNSYWDPIERWERRWYLLPYRRIDEFREGLRVEFTSNRWGLFLVRGVSTSELMWLGNTRVACIFICISIYRLGWRVTMVFDGLLIR